eukprot:maker-scaffold69_size418775-snap-gene-1.8 protein:Tk03250 transcript:maker-scaffold69_size418775-snap-gene-1.8-mRNA-1 annotation:"integral membrane protein duf6"
MAPNVINNPNEVLPTEAGTTKIPEPQGSNGEALVAVGEASKPASSIFQELSQKVSKVSNSAFDYFDKSHIPFGQLMAVGSSITMSALSLLVVLISTADAYVIAACRNLITFVLSVPLVVSMGVSLWPKEHKKVLFARAVFSTCAILLNYYALKHMPIGDCQMIYATSPVMVSILSAVFLKESISANSMVSLVCAIPGLILIIQPPQIFTKTAEEHQEYENVFHAACMCVLAVFCVGFATVCSRVLRNMNCLVLTAWNGFIGAFPGFVIAICIGSLHVPSKIDCFALLGIGLLAMVGQNLFICAIKFEKAGVASLIRKSLDSFLAVIIQMAFFGQFPNTYTIIGEGLILFSVLYSGGYKIAKKSQNIWLRYLFLAGTPTYKVGPFGNLNVGP